MLSMKECWPPWVTKSRGRTRSKSACGTVRRQTALPGTRRPSKASGCGPTSTMMRGAASGCTQAAATPSASSEASKSPSSSKTAWYTALQSSRPCGRQRHTRSDVRVGPIETYTMSRLACFARTAMRNGKWLSTLLRVRCGRRCGSDICFWFTARPALLAVWPTQRLAPGTSSNGPTKMWRLPAKAKVSKASPRNAKSAVVVTKLSEV
mmetsp:Transcript_43065/g.136906  ORF Transcript_43065/g.136906 Transcript_43065/m.136906 type:complete len:208 (+) Transcript_43065:374-997(+)